MARKATSLDMVCLAAPLLLAYKLGGSAARPEIMTSQKRAMISRERKLKPLKSLWIFDFGREKKIVGKYR